MNEAIGVIIAIVSSSLGGSALAVTRYLTTSADVVTLAILRWGIGILVVLPVALVLRVKWPKATDLPAVILLGVCFYGLFFIFYNIAVSYTTAARASLALCTLPLLTMVVGSILNMERMTLRKGIGVAVAVTGAAIALATGLSQAPDRAWLGELIMTLAVLCMAVYNVYSRPLIQRSSALGFLAVGMGAGALVLLVLGSATGRITVLSEFDANQWIAGAYLGIAGGALAFILWVLALERASPTRVANTMTVNPIAASLLGAHLLGEPITPNIVFGLATVFAGIWIATRNGLASEKNGGNDALPRCCANHVPLIVPAKDCRGNTRERGHNAGLANTA